MENLEGSSKKSELMFEAPRTATHEHPSLHEVR
jgi:hypothetical protein